MHWAIVNSELDLRREVETADPGMGSLLLGLEPWASHLRQCAGSEEEKAINGTLWRCPRSRSWKEERPVSLLSLSWRDLYICISSIDFFCSLKLGWIYFYRNSQCKIPGCFFHGLENLKQYSGKNYKQNKDELIQKIYSLLNSSVFDQKVESMNKHLLNTCCMPSSLGCWEVCRCTNCIFPALEKCEFRWGGETRHAYVKETECFVGYCIWSRLLLPQAISRGRNHWEPEQMGSRIAWRDWDLFWVLKDGKGREQQWLGRWQVLRLDYLEERVCVKDTRKELWDLGQITEPLFAHL